MKQPKLNYYEEFIKNSDIALKMSEALKSFVENYEASKAKEVEYQVHKLENSADQNLHEILKYLVKDFLPPIDREDIVLLANRIDDTIDCIDEIVINLDILNVSGLRDNFKKFIELINELCIKQKEMLEKFKVTKKYNEVEKLVIEINNLEESGDRIYEDAIRGLYKNETSAIEVLKWNTIYNLLENCFDSFESVANTVWEIIMKNA